MTSYMLLLIYLLNNFYFPRIGGFPTDLVFNLFLTMYFILFKNPINIKRNFFYLIIVYMSYIAINMMVTYKIYYFYQFIRNCSFIYLTYLIYSSIPFRTVFKSIYSILWINNIVILLQILNVRFVKNIVNEISPFLGIVTRMDYRANGIVDGSLKAGLITVFLFLYTLFFINNKYFKVCLGVLLFAFAILQARTATILLMIILFVYLFMTYKNNFKNLQKKIINNSLATILIVSISSLLASFLRNNLPYFQNTLNWQTKEIFNLE